MTRNPTICSLMQPREQTLRTQRGQPWPCTSPQEGREHPSISNGHDKVQHKTMTQTAVSREDRTLLSVPTHSSDLVLKKRHFKKTVVLYHARKLAQCSLLKMLKR